MIANQDNELFAFVDEVLTPALMDEYLDRAFPLMEFKKRNGRWESSKYLDGNQSHKAQKTYAYTSPSFCICENGADSLPVIKFAQKYYGKEYMETIEELANVCGLKMPEKDPQWAERRAKAKAKQDGLLESKKRQMAALFTQEGAEALRYLREVRGYSDEIIKKMEWGYCSEIESGKIESLMGNPFKWNKKHFALSLPYVFEGKLLGFKFRYFTEEAKKIYGTAKYRNTFDKMNGRPYLFSSGNVNDTLIMAEGEADIKHLYALGYKNVAATSGGNATHEALSYIKTKCRKLRKIYFIPDNDEKSGAGYQYVKKVQPIVEELGLEPYVITLPNEVKDIDEYLTECNDSIEPFKQLMEEALYGAKWRYNQVAVKTYSIDFDTVLPDATEYDADKEVYDIITSTNNIKVKGEILNAYTMLSGHSSIKEFMEMEMERREIEHSKEQAAAAAVEATKLIQEKMSQGKISDAIAIMEDTAAHHRQAGLREKYGDLIKPFSWDNLMEKFKNKKEPLRTPYTFDCEKRDILQEVDKGNGKKTKEMTLKIEKNVSDHVAFTIPSGALTIIAAPTSHGKSTMLRNLALYTAQDETTEGDVLYLTFEESDEDVIAQMINLYVGKTLHEISNHHPQIETIKNYFKDGDISYMQGEARAKEKGGISGEQFEREVESFRYELLESNKLRIHYKAYTLETLMEALEFAVRHTKTKAVFIDYLQILRSEKSGSRSRTDELKDICIGLKDFSVKYGLPVVLAAQLNRDARTPLRMDNNQMAESSDIEKAANTIICVWNSTFAPSAYGKNGISAEEKAELEALQEAGMALGNGGKLFARICKQRGGRGVGRFAIWDFLGYCGKVIPNYDPVEDKIINNTMGTVVTNPSGGYAPARPNIR